MTDVPVDNRRSCPKGGRFGQMMTRDGLTLRTAHWPAWDHVPCVGTVMIVQGHREFIEKYFEMIHDLLTRGYAVHTLDLRGQGLSEGHVTDRARNHVPSFDLYLHDLHRYVFETGLTSTKSAQTPLYLLGHSQGGHLALRYLHDHPEVFNKAVLLSPMINIHFGNNIMEVIAGLMVRTSVLLGQNERHAMGQGVKDSPLQRNIAFRLLTHDQDRFDDQQYFIDQNAALMTGGATYGWVDAALASIARTEAPGFSTQLRTPILMMLAGEDHIVNNRHALKMAARLSRCQVVQYPQARHEIYKEIDPVYNAMWAEIDQFWSDR